MKSKIFWEEDETVKATPEQIQKLQNEEKEFGLLVKKYEHELKDHPEVFSNQKKKWVIYCKDERHFAPSREEATTIAEKIANKHQTRVFFIEEVGGALKIEEVLVVEAVF